MDVPADNLFLSNNAYDTCRLRSDADLMMLHSIAATLKGGVTEFIEEISKAYLKKTKSSVDNGSAVQS